MDLTALAYEEGAEAGEGDDAFTRRLASPYVSFFSAFTRWISFSRIQTGHVFDEEKWSPLQFTQQRDSDVHSPPSWPSRPHFQHFGSFFAEFPRVSKLLTNEAT